MGGVVAPLDDVPALSRGDRVVTLGARTTVGRDPSCELRLRERRVSGLHARLTWTGERWVVRDLGSTNGTFLDGARLPPGVDRPITAGARVAFGVPEDVWVVHGAGPPVAVAVNTSTGEVVRDERGMLSLLCSGGETCVVLRQEDRWVLVGEAGSRRVVDGEVLTVGDTSWRLRLPVGSDKTHRSMADGDLEVALSFRVGADEETLRVTVITGGEQHALRSRACHYLLLTLARARIADHAAGLGVVQAGWRDVDELCRLLGADANLLNVHIHRIRRQLARYHVPGQVIERRAREGLLRIGVSRLIVRPD